MDIMYANSRPLSQMILSGEKTIDFRKQRPKHLNTDDTIYIYESGRNHGAKAVVGQCRLQEIIPICGENGKEPFPAFGAYTPMLYFLKQIKKDIVLHDRVKQIFDQYDPILTKRYKRGYILEFLFSPEDLLNIKTNGEPVDTWKLMNQQAWHILEQRKKARELIQECDEWLTHIGFYNEYGESQYRFMLLLSDPVTYEKPISINKFRTLNNKPLSHPPQSYLYVTSAYNN